MWHPIRSLFYSLLYDPVILCRFLLQWPWRGVDHPPPSSAEVKERVELYFYSPSGPSWPVLGWTLPLPLLCPFLYKFYYGRIYQAPHYVVFFHLPVTSSLLSPNILLNTLFSNTLSLRSSFEVGKHKLLYALKLDILVCVKLFWNIHYMRENRVKCTKVLETIVYCCMSPCILLNKLGTEINKCIWLGNNCYLSTICLLQVSAHHGPLSMSTS